MDHYVDPPKRRNRNNFKVDSTVSAAPDFFPDPSGARTERWYGTVKQLITLPDQPSSARVHWPEDNSRSVEFLSDLKLEKFKLKIALGVGGGAGIVGVEGGASDDDVDMQVASCSTPSVSRSQRTANRVHYCELDSDNPDEGGDGEDEGGDGEDDGGDGEDDAFTQVKGRNCIN